MTESIGTAAVYLTVNTEGMDAGIAAATRKTKDFARTAQDAAQKAEQASKRQIASLEKQAATLGMSREEQIRWNIAQKASGAEAARLNAILDAQVKKLNDAAAAHGRIGLSAKEQAFAMRGLPAQLTDIATGLASGQRPLTVLLQQGGQLKDMFGGVVPAAKALGSAIAGLINPFTIAAGAAAALGLAWKQGSDEAVAFNQALALTGNIAGTTSEQLQGMALSISQGIGTQHEAAEALAEVAKTGKFTADQLRDVAAAAVAMEVATGKAISETVGEFAKLGEDPVKAVVALNEQYHFLTESTYQQIKALQEQGRVEEATTLAIQTASRELRGRAQDVIENAGAMETAWRSLKGMVVDTWDAIRDAGRDSTEITRAQMSIASANSSLMALSGRIKTFIANGGVYTPEQQKRDQAEIARLKGVKEQAAKVINDDPATKAAAQKAARQRTQDLLIAQEQGLSALGTAEEKRAKRIALAHGEANALIAKAQETNDKALIEQVTKQARANEAAIVKAIEAEAKTKKTKGDGGLANASSRADLQGLKDDLAAQTNALENAKKLVEERFKSGLVSVGDYYKELRRINEESGQAQVDSIQKQIAAIEARKVAGKDQINAEKEVASLQAKAAQVRSDTATRAQVLDLQEKRSVDAKAEAIRAYIAALNLSNEALQADFTTRAAAIGMGRREFEIQSELNKVLREQADERRDLAHLLALGQRGESGGITQEQYDERISALQRYVDDRQRIVREGFAAELEAQSKWQNGATAALKDFSDEAADVAGQTYDIFRSAFDGLSDVITDFILTGKGGFHEFLDDIERQIMKFVVNQQLTKFLEGLSGATNSNAQGNARGNAGNILAGLAQSISGGGWGGIAKGAAFGGGQKIEKYAMGGVFDQTTPFRHGSRIGVLGEAGPEAIVPLHRGSDGKLGIRMQKDAMPGPIGPTVVNQSIVVQGRIDSRTPGQFAQATAQAQNRASARNR